MLSSVLMCMPTMLPGAPRALVSLPLSLLLMPATPLINSTVMTGKVASLKFVLIDWHLVASVLQWQIVATSMDPRETAVAFKIDAGTSAPAAAVVTPVVDSTKAVRLCPPMTVTLWFTTLPPTARRTILFSCAM